ncbi:hypothetical protein [Ruficoccus sp. ZRK36]|uniref:hypothetical protein n=1 Tax=Ruficoccus sp. ZRK36 TaxID=2866311 RepID=UPI001C7399D6|nr:hypothetical protein [Ruficoccus sp. ZRK36]QYY35259.1 hypothetical protein K0V07_13280 [Ruficoccus sp. ZRK36]
MIDYVEVPESLYPVLGEPDPGTRIYRKDGPSEECGAWFNAVTELVGPCVSPGGVCMYCPVTRAAVHKKIKEGTLTIFLFHTTHQATNLWGKKKTYRDSPYGYVPVIEAQQWRRDIEDRAIIKGTVTREELEGAHPDWRGDFLEWRKSNERIPLGVVLEQNGMSYWDFFKEFASASIGGLTDAIRPKKSIRTGKGKKQ